MGYFVAAGKSITTPRGMITGGDADSEVTWKCLCRDDRNEEFVASAKASIIRLLGLGILVEADEMPLTPVQVQEQEAADSITQNVSLQLNPKDDGPPLNNPDSPVVTEQTVEMVADESEDLKVREQSVSMRVEDGDPEPDDGDPVADDSSEPDDAEADLVADAIESAGKAQKAAGGKKGKGKGKGGAQRKG